MLKLSHYVVPTEFYDHHDQISKCILFGTRKNTTRLIDDNTWQLIKQGRFLELGEEVLTNLQEAEILVSCDENELQTILRQNNEYINNSDNLYLVIQPTAFCPFGCHYCGQAHSPKKLTEENQAHILTRLHQKLSKKKYSSLDICWFGAEPLSGITVINSLSPQLQAIAREYGLNYQATMVTNGLLLTPQIVPKLVNEFQIRSIEITLDGIAEFHDKRRHTKENGATFDRIYSNLIEIANMEDLEVEISLRCNVDARNKDGISPLIEMLTKDGLHKKISLYMAQIHSWGNDAHKLAASKEEFAKWEIEWLIQMEEAGFNVSYLPQRKKQVCMAVNKDSELIDPNGEVYGCTEVSLVPSYEKNGINIHKLGHVSEQTLDNAKQWETFGTFYQEDKIKQYQCYTCPMLPTCGGACPKEWHEGRVPCPPPKFNIKERVLLHYLKYRENEQHRHIFNYSEGIRALSSI